MVSDKVLIAISNLTCFYAIENDIKELFNRKIDVDIVVIESYGGEIRHSIESVIIEKGFKLKSLSEVKKEKYKILLEPYIITSGINAEFRIRYEYGVTPASVKPDPVYTPGWNLPYDAEICYSPVAANILSAYTKPYIIKPLQFNNFTHHNRDKKINLLVLFTWGDVSATHKLIKIKEQLGDEYNLIIKAHHGVEYLKEHKKAEEELKNAADEYYDAATNVNWLFEKADVVLTDNSSAVFTAIYLDIPATIYSEASNDYYNMNGIKAAHFSLLIEPKRIPYTSKINEVKNIIEQALKNIDSQKKLKKELYPQDVDKTLSDVVEKYLQLHRKDEPYYIIRDLLMSSKKEMENTITAQIIEIENLKRITATLERDKSALNAHIVSLLGVKRSTRLLLGNIKRKVSDLVKRD